MKSFTTLSWALVACLPTVVLHQVAATEFDSIGSVSRLYNSSFSGRENNMKWFFLGTGQDTAAVWDGAEITVGNSVWPEFNGEWYLRRNASIAEHWELWDTPTFDNVQATANGGRPTVSDGDGIPGAFVIPGHPGFVQGTDTIVPLLTPDARPSIAPDPAHMWAPGNTNGTETPGITTLEVKLSGLTDYTGTSVEIVENFWSDLLGQTFYLQFLRTDGNATRHLIWGDPTFTQPVLPANPSAAGDFITGIGGNGSSSDVYQGYLFATLNGRFVEPQQQPSTPVPEPASLAIWSLLGLGAVGYNWRRRGGKRLMVEG